MLTPAAPILLGLASAITWGGADFAGGLAARHASPGKVIFIAHGVSVAVLGLLLVVHPPGPISGATMGLGLASGVSGAVGLMVFYRALSTGAMGLSAAIAGLLTAALPVALAILEQGRPGKAQAAGFAVAALAIALIAGSPGERTQLRTLGMATLAGIGFGIQLIVLHIASTQAGVIPALTLSRLAGTATGAAAMLLASRLASGRGAAGSLENAPAMPLAAALSLGGLGAASAPTAGTFLLLAATTGLLDTAGNGLYMAAALAGRLDVAAVLASLYPGATILLAAWLLKERTSRMQTLGMALALVAVALISA